MNHDDFDPDGSPGFPVLFLLALYVLVVLAGVIALWWTHTS